MRNSILKLVLVAAVAFAGPLCAEEKYVPEEGSVELAKKKRKGKSDRAIDPALPNVLIIGDSISMGYTGTVKAELASKANVFHNAGNSQGTTNGLAKIDEWLAVADWDVIHFNFGLHDLKRVTEAGTSNNSNDPNDPYQANVETYAANLKKIVTQLRGAGANLIFATTTPFPSGVKPFRAPGDAGNYNAAALKIMRKNNIEVNDLYTLVLPDLATLQKPANVHFDKAGSELMGKQVAGRIEAALAE
tara:strand:- start:1678 stop:2415 length:738 start_codon:yes stop_codon:yes gene_type:complete